MPRPAPRAALAAALCAVACAAALAVAPAAHAGPKMKAIWGPTGVLPSGSHAFDIYDRLEVDALHLQLRWYQVAPRRPREPRDPRDPRYLWPDKLNRAVRKAAQRGIQVVLLVKGTPRWANGRRGPEWVPDKNSDYANFLRAAARRYPTVRRWVIWGEPTRPENFQPSPRNSPVGPRRYATLLHAAYGALKRSDPRNIIIGGNTFTTGTVYAPDFIKWMKLPNGMPPRLDEYGHNPFSRRYPDLRLGPDGKRRDICDVDTLVREVRAAYAVRGIRPKLWLGEFSISSDRKNRAFSFYVSRDSQAKWVKAAYQLAHDVPYIRGLGWFSLLDEPKSVSNGLTTGLMEYEGRRKPAYWAYRDVP